MGDRLTAAFAVTWTAALLAMTAYIVGAYRWGWTADHLAWWVALVALLSNTGVGLLAWRADR